MSQFSNICSRWCVMFTTSLVMSLLLSGCAVQQVHLVNKKGMSAHSSDDVDHRGLGYRPDSRDAMRDRLSGTAEVYVTPKTLFNPPFSHKGLEGYAEQLTMALMNNAQGLSRKSMVGVASFVELDSSLQNTSVLGNQLAELLITEVQQFGVPVIDYKMMDEICIEDNGDIVFSRSGWDVSSSGVDYVLAGTLIRNEKGVKVNARIVRVGPNVVVSSASSFIPHFVVASLTPNVVSL